MPEPTETDPAVIDGAVEDRVEHHAASASGTTTVDLSNRPDAAWLDQVEGDIDDVDVVLKCLARNSTSMCATCSGLSTAGELENRSVLAHCASGKQPS